MTTIDKGTETRSVKRTATTVAEKPAKTATLTVRGVDERVRRKIKLQASMNGRSMEAEIRHILEEAVRPVDVGLEFYQLGRAFGGLDDFADAVDEVTDARHGGRG